MLPSLPESVPADPAADLEVCRASLRVGSRSFFAASRLLPKAVRNPACVLYSFCRSADDAIDQDGGGIGAIARLRTQLDGVYSGHPAPAAVDRALARVVRQFNIPRTLLDALIEGFEWDVQARQYEDLAALQAYAARVAGTVGAMMALLMGVRDPLIVARACDLGVAMQLTNIARDVGEDARAGRLYLPLVWLREAGIDPGSWLRQPRFDAALAGVVRRLLHTADTLYAAADEGVAGLPKACRPGINAARFLYAEIGQIVRQSGCDSVSRRAVVPMRRKLVLLLGAFCHRIAPFPAARSTALAETHFLLAEVTVGLQSMPPSEPLPAALAWWRFHSRLVWLIDLFARLEHSERHQQLDRI